MQNTTLSTIETTFYITHTCDVFMCEDLLSETTILQYVKHIKDKNNPIKSFTDHLKTIDESHHLFENLQKFKNMDSLLYIFEFGFIPLMGNTRDYSHVIVEYDEALNLYKYILHYNVYFK